MVSQTFHSYLIQKWRRSWYNRMGVTVNTTALFAQMERWQQGDLLLKCGTTLENRGREGEVYSSVLGENMWTWKWHAHTDPTHPLRPRRSLLQSTTTHYHRTVTTSGQGDSRVLGTMHFAANYTFTSDECAKKSENNRGTCNLESQLIKQNSYLLDLINL